MLSNCSEVCLPSSEAAARYTIGIPVQIRAHESTKEYESKKLAQISTWCRKIEIRDRDPEVHFPVACSLSRTAVMANGPCASHGELEAFMDDWQDLLAAADAFERVTT